MTGPAPAAVSWPRVVVAVLVALVWAVVMLVDAFSEAFTAPASASGALALVGYLFGRELRKAAGNGNGQAATNG